MTSTVNLDDMPINLSTNPLGATPKIAMSYLKL